MKTLKKMFWLMLVVLNVFCISAFAADGDFRFTLIPPDTQYSSLATKSNGYDFASVDVTTAPDYKFKYAVATGKYTGYVSGWKTIRGTQEFDLSYTSRPSDDTGYRLHAATVEASGTSTIIGTWIP